MAIAYQSSTSFTDGNGTSIATVAKPASTAIGDCLVAQCYIESGSTLTIASTGDTWTSVHSIINTTPTPDIQLQVWLTIVANSSSTIGVTWDPGGSFWRDFSVHRFTGVDTTTPQDVAATENTGNGATATGLGLASGSSGRHFVMCVGNFDSRTHSSWASPLAERNDSGNVGTGSGEDTAGTDTANKTVTLSAGGAEWAAILLALKSADGGEPAVVPQRMLRRLRGMGV